MTQRVGFCCIVLDADGKTPAHYKFRTATVKYVTGLAPMERVAYLQDIVESNCRALLEVVNALAHRPAGVRMFRITSGFFPLYTHEVARPTYSNATWMKTIYDALAMIGRTAREHSVRLSFHPGQFCVLNSTQEQVRLNSIDEFEYMVGVADAMGYRGGADGFCVNVHGGAGWRDASSYESWDWSWARLSANARRLITLENDEYSWSAPQILTLCERLGVRMVLDVHHEWIASGRWLEPQSRGAQRVRETWGGAAPKLHLSLCDPMFISQGVPDKPLPPTLLTREYLEAPMFPRPTPAPRNLRAHSGYIWYPGAIGYMHRWMRAGWDVMLETKLKNLASFPAWRALQLLEDA